MATVQNRSVSDQPLEVQPKPSEESEHHEHEDHDDHDSKVSYRFTSQAETELICY